MGLKYGDKITDFNKCYEYIKKRDENGDGKHIVFLLGDLLSVSWLLVNCNK